MNRIAPMVLLMFMLGSCARSSVSNHIPIISVSIIPQQYFIDRLAGNSVEVNVMIPPGASPATYEPTISQLSKLDQSNVYMKVGHVGFEITWMDKIGAINPDMKIVDLSSGIELIHDIGNEQGRDHQGHNHSTTDPHIWMSVINARIIAKNIHTELIRLLPGEKEILTEKFKKFNFELDSLHQTISQMLGEVEEKGFMIYHPALTYFARDYNLNQFPLEIDGKTPSPGHMRRMIDLGRKKNISTILIQSQFDRKNAETLANEIGAKIIQFDPLDPQWHEQMLYIAHQLNSPL